MLLNQSSVIHTKSGCNKEKRLTQLCVPADYLVLESQRGTQSMSPHRALKLYLPHASCLHPYHWLLAPLWLLITKTRLWCELNQPWLSHVRVQLTLTWWKSMSSSPSPLLHPHSVFLSPIPPSPPSPLLKVANELWIPLIHILSKVLVSPASIAHSASPRFHREWRRWSQGKRRVLYCCVSSLLAFSKYRYR